MSTLPLPPLVSPHSSMILHKPFPPKQTFSLAFQKQRDAYNRLPLKPQGRAESVFSLRPFESETLRSLEAGAQGEGEAVAGDGSAFEGTSEMSAFLEGVGGKSREERLSDGWGVGEPLDGEDEAVLRWTQSKLLLCFLKRRHDTNSLNFLPPCDGHPFGGEMCGGQKGGLERQARGEGCDADPKVRGGRREIRPKGSRLSSPFLTAGS
uniref:Uncharacterized protein n=1 Tax=Chromera velia CCMP2878 TaxID=1169474 RepID=A0A0G4IG66_9ALVE|eukprot:Cvel_14140.t1-p1 / transcript=Cvel_14140.t1 / gene=Cvel_14140 / organism=Chromera_velia_CCMP2878 / gene_product=hypothetical protein / transcript_product=hypothetical protein / location=Cvel_scaffold996:37724-38344(+) / protein_length=207 / sequence_SO=supercontig / SO=protein_coding / is_pseudo=false